MTEDTVSGPAPERSGRPPTRVGVLGLARSGRAAAELALARGYAVFASDAGDAPIVREAADRIRAAGGEAETGGHSVERLARCDLLVVSPGVPPGAAVLADERLSGIERISELEFAFRHLACPVVAVTGTNGKTTTTALAAHLFRASGFDAPAAGNIGRALSEVALQAQAPDWAVVEASSFQLADIDTFSPRIGAVTNLSPDHLDRYPSVEAYYADKAHLFDNADPESTWLLGAQAEVLRIAGDAAGRRIYVFAPGHGAPASGRAGVPSVDDPGVEAGFVSDGVLRVRLEGRVVELVRADELRLLGAHNQANALFAALAALVAGADAGRVRDGLRSFAPLAHRLEPISEVDGVLWINDSKATNLESTRVALRSMTRPTVLLLGGRHKGEPYSGLLQDLGAVKAVVAYGEAAPRVVADLGGHVEVERVDGGFEAVLGRAAARAAVGDAVLLSPACSSFDMFRDYEDRGEQFRRLVRRREGGPHGA